MDWGEGASHDFIGSFHLGSSSPFFSEFFSALSAHTFPWMRRLSRPAAHVAGILPCVREHAACFQFISNLKVTGRPASNRVLSTHTTCRAR